jgi:hypothetical protein
MLDRSIYVALLLHVLSFYRASARTNPPIMAREPEAIWAAAALFEVVAVALLLVADVEEACVFAALVLDARVVERV